MGFSPWGKVFPSLNPPLAIFRKLITRAAHSSQSMRPLRAISSPTHVSGQFVTPS